jgi:hypothetical protein
MSGPHFVFRTGASKSQVRPCKRYRCPIHVSIILRREMLWNMREEGGEKVAPIERLVPIGATEHTTTTGPPDFSDDGFVCTYFRHVCINSMVRGGSFMNLCEY